VVSPTMESISIHVIIAWRDFLGYTKEYVVCGCAKIKHKIRALYSCSHEATSFSALNAAAAYCKASPFCCTAAITSAAHNRTTAHTRQVIREAKGMRGFGRSSRSGGDSGHAIVRRPVHSARTEERCWNLQKPSESVFALGNKLGVPR